VEKQPPQVLMKDKKFQCQLRHLVADGLSIHQVTMAFVIFSARNVLLLKTKFGCPPDRTGPSEVWFFLLAVSFRYASHAGEHGRSMCSHGKRSCHSTV